jgi:cysteine synthase
MAEASLGRAVGAAAAAALSISVVSYFLFFSERSKLNPWKKNRLKEKRNGEKRRRGLVEAVGNTPLIRINSLSDATGCEVHCLLLFFYVLLNP